MNIVYKLVIALLASSYMALCVADVDDMQHRDNPLQPENKDAAKFGVLMASTALSYAKSVRRVDGATIVDVVVGDKLCHVTVDDSAGKWLAKRIVCDSGHYFKTKR